jgi:hypothetical protein
MGIFEFISAFIGAPKNGNTDPMIVVEVLRKENELQSRLQRSGLLSATDVPCTKEAYGCLLPCSWNIWGTLNSTQKQDILEVAFKGFMARERNSLIFAHIKGVDFQGAIHDDYLTAAYTDPTVNKILIGDQLMTFGDFVSRYANDNFTVDHDIHTGLNVKMSAVE